MIFLLCCTGLITKVFPENYKTLKGNMVLVTADSKCVRLTFSDLLIPPTWWPPHLSLNQNGPCFVSVGPNIQK